MTNKEEKSRAGGLTKHLDIVVATVLLVLFIMGVSFVFGGEGGDKYSVSCDEYDGSVKTEWIISDNITSYEDIPQGQKENFRTIP